MERWIRKELEYPGPLHEGDRGYNVRRLQEHLTLAGFKVVVDGIFGKATDLALERYQQYTGNIFSGVLDRKTWESLVEPMQMVVGLDFKEDSYEEAIRRVAECHLMAHPREVGGANKGPWVRLYCQGEDGADYAWCAGFVSFVLKQAGEIVGEESPLGYTLDCDVLANRAKRLGTLSSEPLGSSVFLIRRSPTDWTHTGIVIGVDSRGCDTIEGNTNDEGSREGYEVSRRVRGFRKLDFISV